ncbi:hypothetical protein PoB_006708000 [Plakobranchus ocellatus]|uniref:Uncharacterized protein n=1 Tax=Plakobranchus ocellatus TaxID=259542 RepID=A0AAV4D9D2_9GAST|nr:hypothetical protein PoB_006708000 [Plakobranchus ocellatus]
MSAFDLDESLTQRQRDGAAVSNETTRVPVQSTTVKPHLNLIRSRHAKELPQFYFRSDLMKVLQAIEGIKNYLEDNMAQGPKVCPHDNIRCVRMCFVILKHLTPLEAIQERNGEKCITLDLDRSNSGHLAPCNSSPTIHVIAVSLHMAAVFLACAVHI